MNTSSGTIIIHSEYWATPEELYQSSFTKEEHLQRAYDSLLRDWGVQQKRLNQENYFIGPGWDEAHYYKD